MNIREKYKREKKKKRRGITALESRRIKIR